MLFNRVGISACVAVLAFPAVAQVQQVTPNYDVVEHGSSIKVAHFGTYNPDCSSIGHVRVNLVSAPQRGTVEVANGSDYPSYNTNNVRFQCDRRRLPSTEVFYKAAPNFTGTDTFTVEVVFGTGEARQDRFTVYVR